MTITRRELDALAAHHQLSPQAVGTALELAEARPTPDEIQRFAVRLLQIAGVLSVAAGVVFFIAANWQGFRVFGRFALIEALLAVSAAVAIWKPPPAALGRYAVLMAFVATGALLALFGQTYQTGADVYELFLTWSLLGLPIVAAGLWSVPWAAWVLVLNVALALYCGWRPESGWLWIVFAAWNLSPPLLTIAAGVVDLSLWIAAQQLERTRLAPVARRWLVRFVLACAIGFITWGGGFGLVIANEALPLYLAFALLAGVAGYAARQRADVFPLALVAASLIVLGACVLGKSSGAREEELFFLLSAWLVVSSTAAGWLLMRLVKSWHRAEATI